MIAAAENAPARVAAKLASSTMPSWNQIAAWLQGMDSLRQGLGAQVA